MNFQNLKKFGLEEDIISISDDFDFWFPAEIEKANSETKNEDEKYSNMKMKGLASTEDVDFDNQILETKGLECDYLLEKGFINWHHQAKNFPSAIIGEPEEAKVITQPVGLFVKGVLYDTPTSREVYDLAETLQKQSKKRRIGWSIEGKTKEKDGNRIKKAALTGIALTHAPKNKNTFAEICKAMIDGSTTEKIIATSNSSVQGKDFILSTSLGTIYINNGNVHFIEKALTAENSVGVLSKESLLGSNEKIKMKKIGYEDNLFKLKVLEKVLNKYPDITFEKAMKITDLIMIKK